MIFLVDLIGVAEKIAVFRSLLSFLKKLKNMGFLKYCRNNKIAILVILKYLRRKATAQEAPT